MLDISAKLFFSASESAGILLIAWNVLLVKRTWTKLWCKMLNSLLHTHLLKLVCKFLFFSPKLSVSVSNTAGSPESQESCGVSNYHQMRPRSEHCLAGKSLWGYDLFSQTLGSCQSSVVLWLLNFDLRLHKVSYWDTCSNSENVHEVDLLSPGAHVPHPLFFFFFLAILKFLAPCFPTTSEFTHNCFLAASVLHATISLTEPDPFPHFFSWNQSLDFFLGCFRKQIISSNQYNLFCFQTISSLKVLFWVKQKSCCCLWIKGCFRGRFPQTFVIWQNKIHRVIQEAS